MIFLRLFIIMVVFTPSLSFAAYEGFGIDSPLYAALEKRLKQIDRELSKPIDEDAEFIPFVDFGNRIIKQGVSHANMPLLRAKLIDYLPDDAANDVFDPYLYDSNLYQAVVKFQTEKGLKNDGIVGPATLEILNRTLEDERKQVLVNMYRLKQPEWQYREPLRIDVDIARYWLKAYEDGKVVFEMPVIVGTKQRATNIFSTVMTGVRLNPGWTLPPTIKSEDYIPKLRTNPEWVTEQGVMIYTGWDEDAEPVDPLTIDWNYLTDGEIKAMRFYKQAGNENPLGQYRFLMNNRYDIYLHDTNQKYLFDRSARAKSSGCVRVYDPRKIAEFLLKDNPDWTAEKLDRVLDSGKTFNIGAKRSIPVHFDYKTAWLDESGDLILGVDIYDLDDGVYRDILNSSRKASETVQISLDE
jgi:L,D-transpeptidase YcbB